MLYTNFIEKVETNENTINIFCKLQRKACKCPVCSEKADKIHNYRTQIIKDIPIRGKRFLSILEKDVIAVYVENDFLKIIHFFTKMPQNYRTTC